MMVEFRDYTVYVQLDDKNSITGGEPDEHQPVVPRTRAKNGSAIGLAGAPASRTMDHGTGARSKVVPSKTLIHDIPLNREDSWYRGQLVSCLK